MVTKQDTIIGMMSRENPKKISIHLTHISPSVPSFHTIIISQEEEETAIIYLLFVTEFITCCCYYKNHHKDDFLYKNKLSPLGEHFKSINCFHLLFRCFYMVTKSI